MIKRQLLPLALCIAGLFSSAAARAELLAQRVPADAIGFVSWAGTDALGPSYSASHLKALLEAMNVPQLIAQRLADAVEKNAADPQKQADEKTGQEWLQAALKAPTGLYFGPVDFANADQPQPKIALFSKIGKEQAAAFAPQINAAIQRHKKPNTPSATASVAGDFLLLTVGDVPDFDKRLSGEAPAENLAALPAFKTALTQVGAGPAAPSPAALIYLDGPAALKMLDDAVDAKGDNAGRQNWPKVEDAMGLPGLRQCAFAGNFDGPNWTSQAFIGLNAQRTGLIAFLDAKRLTDEVIKLIPASATWAGIARFDGSRFLQDLRDAAARADAQNGPRMIDAGLQQFFAVTGVDLQKDLLDALGDAYAYYGAPDAAGHTFKNTVVASKLQDPGKAENALASLESIISTMIAQRAPNAPVTFRTEPLSAPNEKVSLHVVALPALEPAWTVANGTLYASASTAGIQAAIEQAGKGAPIFENAQFAELWKKLGQKDVSSFTFVDFPKVVTEAYPLLALGWARRQTEHPEEKSPLVLPPLEKLTANLSPALSIFWSDADGYHAKGTGPFPLAEAVNPPVILLQGLAARQRRNVQARATPVPATQKKDELP